MKKKIVSMITALALVLAMMPGLAFAADGAETAKISFSDCAIIGELDAYDAVIYYADIDEGSTAIELTDLEGSIEDGVIVGLLKTGYKDGTNVVDLSVEFALSSDDLMDAYGEYLDEDAMEGLDLSNIYGFFIMDDDGDCYMLIVNVPKEPEPEKTYGFKISAGGSELTDIEKEEGAYSYTNWMGVTSKVDLYTVTVPEGTESADFVVESPVLAYNYAKNDCTDDDYLAGATVDWMVGNKEFSAKIDYNKDGNNDFIQIQTPYDAMYNSTLLYAVTFKFEQPLTAPKISASLLSNKKAEVKWDKVDGASSYIVYYKAAGAKKWSSKKTASTKLAFSDLKPGVKYSYKVAATNGKKVSEDSAVKSVTTLAKVKGLKVAKKNGKFVMKWKSVSTAQGYQKKVYQVKTKNWTGIAKGSKLSATKFRTAKYYKKTYKYKVRAYKKVGGKTIYGPWSDTKTIKAK